MPETDGGAPEFYAKPEEYEALFGSDNADAAFYASVARDSAALGPALELGCGTGRLLEVLAREGLACEGLDSSPAMLAAAEKRLGSSVLRNAVLPRLHRGDWLNADLGRRFGCVLFPYNGLQHLVLEGQPEALLARIRELLLPGGLLALDLHLPQAAILAREPSEWLGVEQGPLTSSGERITAERSAWDPVAQVLTQRWLLASPSGGTRELSLKLRQFFPREIRVLLKAAGYRLLRHDGGFQGLPLGPASLKQVLLATPA